MTDVERRHGRRAAGEAIGEVVGDAFVEALLAGLWRLVLLPLHVVEHLLAA